MTSNEYQKLAMRTVSIKGNYDIAKNDLKNHFKEELLLNGILGLVGESGEAADYYKKHIFQGHELKKEKIADELGDILWYIAITAYSINYNLEDIMKMNIKKLYERYPKGFEVDKSVNR